MNKINTGGPAFPRGEIQSAPGMTLRDYFAAMALQGELSSKGTIEDEWKSIKQLASHVYDVADAMLEAR